MTVWLPLVGVVIAQFVLVGLYFLKQRADDKRRWSERQLIVYSDFLSLGRERSRSLGKVETDNERRESYQEWKASLSQVMLLGAEDVREAAGWMLQGYLECLSKVRRDELEVEDALAEMRKREDHLTAAIRRDLKIDVRPGIF
jgi:hypothetical protein